MDLRYRLAVVTSAGRDPARAVAVALSRQGAAVLVVDPEVAAAGMTVQEVARARVKAWPLQGDLLHDDDVAMVAARARDLGGADLLVTVSTGTSAGAGAATSAGAGTRTDTGPRTQTGPGTACGTADGPTGTGSDRLRHLFLQDLAARRGRRDGSPAAVHVLVAAVPGPDQGPDAGAGDGPGFGPDPDAVPGPDVCRGLGPDLDPIGGDADRARRMVVRATPEVPGNEVARVVVRLLRSGSDGDAVVLD